MSRKPRIELHGWDSQGQAWHGPDELAFSLAGCRNIVRKLRELRGSWHGRLRSQVPGELPLSFCGAIYDLGDAGLGLLDMEGSANGPLEVVVVIPAQRRKAVRPEFAFEFTSFLRFLEGKVSTGWEMAIHDYVQRVLHETGEEKTLVFSIETRSVVPEVHILISQQAGRLAMGMIAWMIEKDAASPARAD